MRRGSPFKLAKGHKHGRFASKAALAKAIGVSGKSIVVWEAEASALGMSFRDPDGMYNSVHVAAFLEKRGKQEADDLGAELKREQIRRLKLENEKRDGTLVPLKDVERFQERFAALLREAAKQLQVQFGNSAFAILDDALARAGKEFESVKAGRQSSR